MDTCDLIIEPLANHHNRADFSCGEDTLDNYIKRQAGQDVKRQITNVFICILPDDPNTIIGYYTLSMVAIDGSSLPEDKKNSPSIPFRQLYSAD